MKEQQRAMNCNLLFVFIRAFSSNPPHWKVLVNAYVGGLIHFSFLHVYIWHFVS